MTITDDEGVDLTTLVPDLPIDAVVHAMRLAPSGGNVQPWSIRIVSDSEAVVWRMPRTSKMDVDGRGTWVALGALALNAATAAAYHGLYADISEFPLGENSDMILRIRLRSEHQVCSRLAAMYPEVLHRETNRNFGEVREFDQATIDRLQRAAAFGGGRLHLITDRSRVATIANILAESDRIRYLSPVLHEQMMAELVKGPSGLGIEERTLALKSHELPVLDILRRADVMACAAEMDQQPAATTSAVTIGTSLGDNTRDRINASSGVMIVTVNGERARDYIRGGWALEMVWAKACAEGLGVQPVSPVFLYAHTFEEMLDQSPKYAAELADLRYEFADIVGLSPREAPILVLRASHNAGNPVRSPRLSDKWVVVDER